MSMNELEKSNVHDEEEKHLPKHYSTPGQAKKRESPISFLKRIGPTLVCIVVLIVLILLSILVGYMFRVRDIHGKTILPENIFQGRTLSMSMGLVNLDPLAGTVLLAWRINRDSACHDSVIDNCSIVNVYFESFVSQAGGSSTPLSNVRQDTPIYQYQPYTHHNVDLYGLAIGQFQTTVTLFPNMGVGSLQNYPFDKYETTAFLFAKDSATNETVGLLLEQKYGVVVGLEVETTPGIPSFSYPPGSILVDINARRGGLVRAYVLCIVISVWLITLIFASVTFYTLFYGYGQRLEFLAIPVATLFTVTQLRTTMPGAPNGFGAIMDYIGLLPCLVMMSICSVVSMAGLAFTDPNVQRVTLSEIIHHAVRRREKVTEAGSA